MARDEGCVALSIIAILNLAGVALFTWLAADAFMFGNNELGGLLIAFGGVCFVLFLIVMVGLIRR